MKTLKSLTFALALLTGSVAFSQGMQASTYLEKTHISPKLGTAMGFEFQNMIEVGGFYQNAIQNVPQREDGFKMYEEQFYGMYLNYPLIGSSQANLKLNVRTGVTNGENFLITPSVLANYSPLKMIALGGGIGVRAFRPTLQASLKIKL